MNDKPIKTFKVGGVKASIWQNESQNGEAFFTTSIARSYRTENGEWKETSTYSRDDLPKIKLASEKAYEFVMMNGRDINDAKSTFQEKIESERAETGAQEKAKSKAKSGK